MAVAAVFVGILSGIVSFCAALVMGQGLAAAAGFYVVGGFLGASALVAFALARAMGEGALQRIPMGARG